MGGPDGGASVIMDPPHVEEVRTASDVYADGIEATGDGPLRVVFGGQEFTCKGNRPAGAYAVFCARLKSSDRAAQTGAFVHLLQAWIIEEDHERLLDVISEVDDMEAFAMGEFSRAIEAMTARPSQAP